jgi:hypothetical protein
MVKKLKSKVVDKIVEEAFPSYKTVASVKSLLKESLDKNEETFTKMRTSMEERYKYLKVLNLTAAVNKASC